MDEVRKGKDRVLVVNFSGLGNALLFKKSLSGRLGVEVDMVVEHGHLKALMEGEPVSGVEVRKKSFFVPEKKTGLFGRLVHLLSQIRSAMGARKRGYSRTVVAYPNSTPSINILTYLTGAPRRFIHRYPSHTCHGGWLNTDVLPIVENLHDIDQNRNIMECAAGKGVSGRVLASFSERRGRVGTGGGVARIGIIPGASPGWLWKTLPPESMAALVNDIFPGDDARVFIYGVEHERGLMEEVAAHLRTRPRLVINRPMDEVMASLRRCDIVFAGDSGLMHVADSLGVPLVAFFGPTPVRTVPTGRKSQVVSRRSPCKTYCYYDRKMKGRNFRCMYSGEEERLCLQGLEEMVRTE